MDKNTEDQAQRIQDIHTSLFMGYSSPEVKVTKLSALFSLLQKKVTDIVPEQVQISSTERLALYNKALYQTLGNQPRSSSFLARIVNQIASELETGLQESDFSPAQKYTGILHQLCETETLIDQKMKILDTLFTVLRDEAKKSFDLQDVTDIDIDHTMQQKLSIYSKIYHRSIEKGETDENTFIHALAKVTQDLQKVFDIYTILYSDVPIEQKDKENHDLQYIWRQMIKTQYSLETFLECKVKDKKLMNIRGKGLNGIASIFEVGSNPIGNSGVYIQLTEKIYGKEEVKVYMEQLQNMWRQRVRKQYPLAIFVEASLEERKIMRIYSKSLNRIASIFEVGGNSIGNSKDFRNLAKKIYGIEEVEQYFNTWKKRLWRETVKKSYSLKEFLQLIPKEARSIMINNHSLKDIGKILINQKIYNFNKSIIVNIAKEIYGAQRVASYMQGKEESLKEAIQKQYSCEEFLGLQNSEKRDVSINNMSLYRIATVLGAEGNPNDNFKNMLNLATKIYGQEELKVYIGRKETIKKKYTIDKFIELTVAEKKAFTINGKNLYWCRSVEDVIGDPIHSRLAIRDLAKKIYGSKELDLYMEGQKKIWKDSVKSQYSFDAIIDLTVKEQSVTKINGKGLIFIAKMFGIDIGRAYSGAKMIELAKQIYGDDVMDRYQDLHRTEIKDLCTRKEFVQLRYGFYIKGKGLAALATVFGIKKFEWRKTKMEELAQKIYDGEVKTEDKPIQ